MRVARLVVEMFSSAFFASAGVAVGDVHPDAGLDGDDAHRVSDHVVQLLRDPQALVGDGPRPLLFLLSLEDRRPLLGLGQTQPSGLHGPPEQERHAEEGHIGGEPGQTQFVGRRR